ncbi:MAG: carbohydrate-binding family 9-like protein [Acidobacteriaceae bacterium]
MTLDSQFTNTDFVPDGDLHKDAWETASKIRFDQGAFDRKQYPTLETMVASRWTGRYLYLAYWCRYENLNIHIGEDPLPERWELWERDVVEAFINPRPGQAMHYYEFEVAPNNQWLDLEIDLSGAGAHYSLWDSGFEHATIIDPAEHIWTVEMRVPLLSMGVHCISPNTEWKVNFYRADGPGDNTERRLLSWGPLPLGSNSFHQPASFGILRFIR